MMRIFKKSYADKSGENRKENKWTLEFCDHIGVTHRISAYNDKRLSESFGRNLEALTECRKSGEQPHGELREWIESIDKKTRDRLSMWGLLTAGQAAASQGIQEQLEGWNEHLKAKQASASHIKQALARVKKVWTECGFSYYSGVDSVKVERWLNLQREKGLGATTCNHYLRSMKAFLNWAVSAQRIARNPISCVSLANEKIDIRRERRALTGDEMRVILKVTEQGEKHHCMSGAERALLYHTAATTGLRWSELRSLKRVNLMLDTVPATVTIQAKDAKNGKDDILPLRPELVETLRAHVALKMPNAPIFGMPKGNKGAAMIQVDMKAARQAWLERHPENVDSDFLKTKTEEGSVDFHALRHSFISSLAQSGVHPSVCQRLARHSDINLTMNKYTHVVLESKTEALNTLPDLTEPSTLESAKATGTDDTDDCFEDRPKDHEKNTPENRPFLGSKAVQNCPKRALSENEEGEKEKASTPINLGVEADFVWSGWRESNSHSQLGRLESDNCNPLPASDLQDSENPHSGLSTGIPENLRREIDIVIDAWPGLSVDIREKILGICSVK